MLVVSAVPAAEKPGCSICGGGSLTLVTFTVSHQRIGVVSPVTGCDFDLVTVVTTCIAWVLVIRGSFECERAAIGQV